MVITIVGAGPVGLLLGCLLAQEHQVTILEKRTKSGRDNGLNINEETITVISDYLRSRNNPIPLLLERLNTWSGSVMRTSDIEVKLTEIARSLGVTIHYGVNVSSIDNIPTSVVIAADGAHSVIRQLVFNDEKVDQHDIEYMAQVKYETPGSTRPRKLISAIGYSFINGLSGSDMVVDFESLAPPNNDLIKPGTLHIPIPLSLYETLCDDGNRGFKNPWKPEELSYTNDPGVSKLLGIISRYHFSLKLRGGWMGNPRITAIPLTIYRSKEVYKLLPCNKLVILVGDAASGLIYQMGLNKGWLEAVQCTMSLSGVRAENLIHRLNQYSSYCQRLYEYKRDEILDKHDRIVSSNHTISATGVALTFGAGLCRA